jgi:hypothetical protein
MVDQPQDAATEDDAPEGAVTAQELKDIPGPPPRDGENMAGPRAAAEERAQHAAESAAAAAAADEES